MWFRIWVSGMVVAGSGTLIGEGPYFNGEQDAVVGNEGKYFFYYSPT